MVKRRGYFTRSNICERSNEFLALINRTVRIRDHSKKNMLQSALLVIDMQNYFLDPGSHAFIPSSVAIIDNIKKLIGFFEGNSRPVAFTKHTNTKDNAMNMKKWWRDLIQNDNYLSHICEEFDTKGKKIIEKYQYDAFHGTDLDQYLKSTNTKTLTICGLATNLCCETTLRSAFVKGYEVIIPIDATATFNEKMHIASMLNIAYGFGAVLKTDLLINDEN